MTRVRIGVVADRQEGHETHIATDAALEDSGAREGLDIAVTWIATDRLTTEAPEVLRGCHGLLIGPGSPYRSMAGALRAIRLARITGLPLLGTCGGFQHIVVEYAMNVIGARDAGHAEYDPDAVEPYVEALACSLAGEVMDVTVLPGTTAWTAYNGADATERYYCSFGISRGRAQELTDAGLVISGTDQDGEVRIIELPDHPFFVGTLFVPQASSRPDAPHPVVSAFLRAASDRNAGARLR